MNFIKIPGKDFEIMDAPVTQGQWQEIMGNNPSHFKDQPDHPVESVSWSDCQEFIQKLNAKQDGYLYRLPNEDEWEYCAKPCDEQDIMKIAWCWENSDKQTHTVKSREPNKYGLYDMLGNVWEWCQDEIYGSNRVVRGGGWGSAAQDLRSGFRAAARQQGATTLWGFAS